MRQHTGLAAMLAVLLVAIPGRTFGQACIGMPSAPGQFGITGGVGFTDAGKLYDGTVNANLQSPLSINAFFGIGVPDDADDNITSFGGSVAYELPNMQFSLCPTAGAQYSTVSTSAFGVQLDVNQIAVPIGLGIGTVLQSPSVDVTLFALPQFLWMRTSVKGSVGGQTGSDSETDSEFAATVGFQLGRGSFFGGMSAQTTTVDEADPVYTVRLGVLVGGRR